MSDLDAPVLVGFHEHPLTVIDHNLYVHGDFLYQSDYEAGVRILRMDNLAQTAMTEVAFFDTYPASNSAASTAPGTTSAFRAAATSSRPASTKVSSCSSRTCAKRR